MNQGPFELSCSGGYSAPDGGSARIVLTKNVQNQVLLNEAGTGSGTIDVSASEVDATPAQTALAWLLAQGDGIAPIPGTKRVARVEENSAADGIELSADQIQRLNDLTPATGERHDEANMSTVDR